MTDTTPKPDLTELESIKKGYDDDDNNHHHDGAPATHKGRRGLRSS